MKSGETLVGKKHCSASLAGQASESFASVALKEEKKGGVFARKSKAILGRVKKMAFLYFRGEQIFSVKAPCTQ